MPIFIKRARCARRFTRLTLLLALAGLLGCNEHGVRETLDEETLVSVIVAEPPLTFFRLRLDEKFERELVNVGAVELIASTERDNYLWFNLWGTRIDGSTGSVPLPRRLTVHTQSGPIELTRSADSHRALRLSSAPFTVIRSGAGEGYYRVDFEQMAALAGDPAAALEIDGQRYELWGNQTRAFAALVRFLDESGL